MSRRIADLLIKIGADSYEFQQKAQQVEKGLGSLEKKLTSVGKSLSLKLTAPFAALGGVSLHLADVQTKAEAKVQQALKVTNQAVGYNFRQLADYASELQGKTLFGDETILDKSTARLLAFTNITGENFNRTQALALDLATALEMDLGSASLQLCKALSDPATKFSSLSRAGITFSKEQTEVIKKLAEQKEIIATTTKTRMVPNFGGLVAGFTLQKVPDESKLAPLRKEYDLLTAAIEKKRETEKKAAEVQAELDKVTDEACKQTEELMKSIAGTNAQTEQSTGIIGKLQARIEALEKKKLLPESTVEDIAVANAEIEKLQKELERIRNIKPEDLKPVVKMDGILPEDFELELPASKLKMGDLKPVTSQYAQHMQTIFGAVREGLYGWADDNSAYLQEHVADTVSMVENYTTALTAKGWSFSAALEHVHATIEEVMTRFDQQVSKFMTDSIVAAAEAIGQIIAGDLGFGGLMKAILTQFASFLKNIGSQLIEFGVMIIPFKSALKSILANPWAAIAIGAAIVAAAAVMTALINKNAEKSVPALANGGLAYGPTYAMVGDNPNAATDPEVIAPLSKLQAMLPTGGSPQNLRITLGGQLTAKGRDLVYVLGKENFKSEVLGG